jgi:hypothetical protein
MTQITFKDIFKRNELGYRRAAMKNTKSNENAGFS